MNRTRDYYRKQRAKHIARKQRMVKEWSMNGNCLYWVAPAGALSKGKIHCSCWMCRRKSYDHKTAKDLSRIEAMNESETYLDTTDYYFEETLDKLQDEELAPNYNIDEWRFVDDDHDIYDGDGWLQDK